MSRPVTETTVMRWARFAHLCRLLGRAPTTGEVINSLGVTRERARTMLREFFAVA